MRIRSSLSLAVVSTALAAVAFVACSSDTVEDTQESDAGRADSATSKSDSSSTTEDSDATTSVNDAAVNENDAASTADGASDVDATTSDSGADSGPVDSGYDSGYDSGDYCAAAPCVNGGTCSNVVGDFACACTAGYSGKTCVTDIDACVNNACTAGQTCVDLAAPALDNAAGRTCNEINACVNNPCTAGQTCVDLVAPALDNAAGRTCNEIDACVNNPCSGGLVCTDLPAPALDNAAGRTCTVSTTGLVAYYTLNENTGTAVADGSGGARNATTVAGSWTPGHTGSAYNGSLRSNAALPAMTQVTVAYWFRRDGAGAGYSRLSSWDSDAFEVADISASDKIGYYLSTGGGWINTGKSFGTGYHHIAFTISTTTVTGYYDGVQFYTAAGTANLTGKISLGVRHSGGETTVGPLDQVRVYSRALNATEVAALAAE